MKNGAIDLDAMLTPAEMARMARITPRYLADKTRGGVIVPFKLGGKLRYHPRTIYAILARRAGVPNDLIAAMFGRELTTK